MTGFFFRSLFILFLVVQGCISNSEPKTEANFIDSLNTATQLKDKIKTDQQISPHVQVKNYEAPGSSVVLYIPSGLKFRLTTSRSIISEFISLIVPAAYTSKKMTIDGMLIQDGKLISSDINKNLTGVCIINSNKVNIVPYDHFKLDSIQLNNESVFQQSLLLHKSEIYPCNIFGNTKSKRRAVVKIDDINCIAESDRPLTILDFQKALKFIGVINAINLDMGSWSEGEYRNHLGQKIKIGDNFINTRFQTSWLLYTN